MRKTTEQRFWEKVDKNGPNGCWEWTAQITPFGYGHIQIDGRAIRAHRYSAELHGSDITDKIVCHKCDNRRCVNPEHLFVGTQKENMADMDSKGRRNPPIAQPKFRKLTDDDVHAIRASELNSVELGKIYGMAPYSIRKILHRVTYKDI